MSVTIKDIAALAGVSFSTVSLVLNGKASENRISEDLEKKIKDYSSSARNLYIKRESEVINPIKNKITEAIKQFAKERGYDLIVDITAEETLCVIVGWGKNS